MTVDERLKVWVASSEGGCGCMVVSSGIASCQSKWPYDGTNYCHDNTMVWSWPTWRTSEPSLLRWMGDGVGSQCLTANFAMVWHSCNDCYKVPAVDCSEAVPWVNTGSHVRPMIDGQLSDMCLAREDDDDQNLMLRPCNLKYYWYVRVDVYSNIPVPTLPTYRCLNSQCVAVSDGGTSLSTCQSVCGPTVV